MKLPIARLLAILTIVFLGLAPLAGSSRTLELPEIDLDSADYRERILAEAAGLAEPAGIETLHSEAKRAQSERKWHDAVRISERIAATKPDDFVAWIALAAAWRNVDTAAVEIAAAAYQAWLLADTDEERAEALLLIIENLHQRQQEPLLQQALQVAGDIVSTQAIARLTAEPSKRRAAPNTTEGEGAQSTFEPNRGADVRSEKTPGTGVLVPVACVAFPAAFEKADPSRYREYIEVLERPDATPVESYELRVEEEHLCFLGLMFGTNYEINFRAGLSARDGSALESDVTSYVWIAAISPQVSFRGRTLFLPEHGEGLVPVSTLNVERLGLILLRIGDRNLMHDVALGKLETHIASSEVVRIRDTTGEVVWRGSMEIDSEPNQPVFTGIPVRDLTDLHRRFGDPGARDDPAVAGILPGVMVDAERVGEVDPGVYALAAADGGVEQAIEDDDKFAVQWLVVTDVGLSLFRSRQDLLVAARSLSEGKPIERVRVQLVSKNNRVLGEAATDGDGIARFDGNLARGKRGNALAGVLAFADDGQFAFLDASTDMLDLGDRGIDGRLPAGALDAYVYTERGIYRPGETVHVAVIVRDGAGKSIDSASLPPLNYSVRAPNDIEILSDDLKEPRDGAFSLTIDVPDTALSGLWDLDIRLGHGGEKIGATSFEVGDFLPGRIDLKLDHVLGEPIDSDSTKNVKVVAEYLYGAPAADLPGEGLVEIREAAVPWAASRYGALPNGLKASDFAYGLADEEFAPRRTRLDLLRTDNRGHAKIGVQAGIPESTQPLEAMIEVQLFDTDGSRTRSELLAPIKSDRDWIGIRQRTPFPHDGVLEFDVLYFDADGTALPGRQLDVGVQRLRDAYAWQRQSNGKWGYEPQPQVLDLWDDDRSVVTDERGMASIRVPIEDLGRFLIKVRDSRTAVVSMRFDSGWTGVPEVPSAPDRARLMLEREYYSPGEQARLTIEAPFNGQGLFLIGNERIHRWVTKPVEENGTDLLFEVEEDWGPCAYVVGSVFRTGTDASRERGPGRALGLAHFCVSENDRKLGVSFVDVGNRILPGRRWDAKVRVDGIAPGDPAFVTVALVDKGILGITSGFEAPNPRNFFLGKRQLGVDIYDAYDRIILSDGVRGTLRSGGGYGQLRGLRFASPIILSKFSGILPVAPDGTASLSFDIPEFSGKVKLMAVAWSGDRYGEVTQEVPVAQTIVSQLRLPRFLAPGDKARASLRIHNRTRPQAKARSFTVEVSLKDEGPLFFLDGTKRLMLQTPILHAGDVHSETVEITPRKPGQGQVFIKVTDPLTGVSYESTRTLSVRLAQAERTRRFAALLEPLSGIDLAQDIRDRIGSQFIGEDLSLAVRISPDTERLVGLGPSDWLAPSPPYLDSLVGYARRLLPDVLPRALGSPPGERGDGPGAREALQKVVHRISGLNTSFGFFRAVRQELINEGDAEDDDRIAQSIRAIDVLIAARERGLVVPDNTLESTIAFVEKSFRSQLALCTNVTAAWLPGAAYVLARTDRLNRTDLEDLAECKLPPNDLQGPSYVAAANCMFGLRDACRSGFRKVSVQTVEGAAGLRGLDDLAMVLALMIESGTDGDFVAPLRRAVAETLLDERSEQQLSIQARAAIKRAFVEKSTGVGAGFDVKIDGKARTVEGVIHQIDGLRMRDVEDPYIITNLESKKPLAVEVLARGVPLPGEESDQAGFVIERVFYDLDGNRLELGRDKLRPGQLVVVQIVGQVPPTEKRKAILVNLMPAGMDVEETELLERQPLSTKLRQITRPPTNPNAFARVALRERRDDRFVAVLDFDDKSRTQFRIHFLARAVVAGDYTLPEVLVEDLEHSEISARAGGGSVSIAGDTTEP